MVSPMAWTFEERREQLRLVAELGRLRIFLGAFGDPGHAFPMIALGERAASRAATTWRCRRGRSGGADVEAAGMTFARRAGVPGVPDARAAAEALRGGGAGGAGDAAVGARRSRPDVVGRRHPHARRRRSPPSSRACRVATLVPHVYPRVGAGLPAVLDRRAAAADAAGRALWRLRRPRSSARAASRAARSTTRRARRLGLRAAAVRPHRALARAGAGRRRSRSSSTRGAWPAWVRVVGPLLWEPPGERVEPPPGARAGRARRAVDLAGPVAPAAARGAGGARGRAGAGDRDDERPRAGRADRRARQRACSSPWLSLRARRCRCATSSSATAATGRWCGRWRRAARSSSARPAAT